ncbi:SDR family NAD(P)-dependent oxidoreductase [Dyadobacter luticola]|uniref:SDR family NAD(P)-dependent oxidoreductase n=1 Tax=Dyadobacter luticola TaxID=1979387 RepID=A0A5R9L5Y5_9BACT|nr:SDR family NAD(P)-dependent oxidoreductase [Dyadobacter luticola]TLV03992.1 SDR family NAD(P)-dependent oxidoreductase [Dyadobacter luticola]
MNLNNKNILITGGSEGIGFGLAARFLATGSHVLVTGTKEEKLESARLKLPELKILVSDIGDAKQRKMLARHVSEMMAPLHIIINNAGIQRRVSLAEDTAPWSERQREIDILFSGPVHLNHLLIPLLLTHKEPSYIINVTSGGAYIPQAFAPVYSACKAALHSYTVTLRHALENTSCSVIELIPPAIATNLAGNSSHGADLDEFCDSVFNKLFNSETETIGYGITENIQPELSGQPVSILFEKSASRFQTRQYSDSLW